MMAQEIILCPHHLLSGRVLVGLLQGVHGLASACGVPEIDIGANFYSNSLHSSPIHILHCPGLSHELLEGHFALINAHQPVVLDPCQIKSTVRTQPHAHFTCKASEQL